MFALWLFACVAIVAVTTVVEELKAKESPKAADVVDKAWTSDGEFCRKGALFVVPQYPSRRRVCAQESKG